MRIIQTRERPASVFGNEWIIAAGKTLEQPDDMLMRGRTALDARISKGHARIANDTAPFSSFDRAVPKNLAEFPLG